LPGKFITWYFLLLILRSFKNSVRIYHGCTAVLKPFITTGNARAFLLAIHPVNQTALVIQLWIQSQTQLSKIPELSSCMLLSATVYPPSLLNINCSLLTINCSIVFLYEKWQPSVIPGQWWRQYAPLKCLYILRLQSPRTLSSITTTTILQLMNHKLRKNSHEHWSHFHVVPEGVTGVRLYCVGW